MTIQLPVPPFRRDFDLARDPYTARNALGIDNITAYTSLGTQFDATNTAVLGNVMSFDVFAGVIYQFYAVLHVDANATGGQKYAIGGTCTASNAIYQIVTINNSTNANVITSRQTALGGSAGQAGSTSNYTIISGRVAVSVSGTLTVQFAENVATPATTSSVLVGSTFEIARTP